MPSNFVLAEDQTSSRVTFKGNFPWSAKVGFEPSLMCGEVPCLLIDSSTVQFTFAVPHSIFKSVDKSKYTFVSGLLRVPWDSGWIFSHKEEFQYRIGFGALPIIAGGGTVEYISHKTERKEKHTSSPDFSFNGNSFYPEHWHTCFQTIFPESGWSVDVTKPPTMIVRHEHGDHKQEIISVAADRIVLKVDLYCKDGHSIGIVWVRVEFDEFQEVPTRPIRSENFTLVWEGSKLLEPEDGEVIKKLTFTNYRGIVDNKILKISAEGTGGVWKIWAQPQRHYASQRKRINSFNN